MVENGFEDFGITVARHHLGVFIGEVAVGTVGAEWDAFNDGGGHVFKVERPHFFGIGAEE